MEIIFVIFRKYKFWIGLFILIIFLEITNFYWLKLNTGPPWWDQSWYLRGSEILYHTLNEQGFGAFWAQWTGSSAIFSLKAPLISLLPLPFYYVFGNSAIVAMGVNLVFTVILCLFLFLLVRNLIGEKGAFLTVVFTSFMPLVFGLSRQFLVEYGLLNLVVIWLYLLLKSCYLQKTIYNILLGIILGLGLLMKVDFPLFIIGPVLVILIERFRKKLVKRLPLDIGFIVFFGFLVAFPWYLKNFTSVSKWAISSGFGQNSSGYAIGSIIYTFWQGLINSGFSLYFFLVFALLLLAFLFFLAIKKQKIRIAFPFYYSFCWFTIPLLVFTLSGNNDPRFCLPVLPAFGLALSYWFLQVVRRFSYVVLPFVLIFPLFLFMYVSYPLHSLDIQKEGYSYKGFILITKNLWYAFPPDQSSWPQEEIINVILTHWKSHDAPVVLVVDHIDFNLENFGYYASMNKSAIIFSRLPYTKENGDWEEAMGAITSDFLITKTGFPGPEFTNDLIQNIQGALDKKELPFVKIFETDLPDQSKAFVYEKLSPIPSLTAAKAEP